MPGPQELQALQSIISRMYATPFGTASNGALRNFEKFLREQKHVRSQVWKREKERREMESAINKAQQQARWAVLQANTVTMQAEQAIMVAQRKRQQAIQANMPLFNLNQPDRVMSERPSLHRSTSE